VARLPTALRCRPPGRRWTPYGQGKRRSLAGAEVTHQEPDHAAHPPRHHRPGPDAAAGLLGIADAFAPQSLLSDLAVIRVQLDQHRISAMMHRSNPGSTSAGERIKYFARNRITSVAFTGRHPTDRSHHITRTFLCPITSISCPGLPCVKTAALEVRTFLRGAHHPARPRHATRRTTPAR
jgi:hypothetical protein